MNRSVMEGLAARGHLCAVVTPSSGFQGGREAPEVSLAVSGRAGRELAGAHYVRFELAGVTVDAVTHNGALRAHLETRIDEFNPDCIIIASQDPGQSLLRTAIASGRAVIYFAQTTQMLPFGPTAFLPNKAGGTLLRRCRQIIAASRFLQGQLREFGGLESVALELPYFGPGPFPNFAKADGGMVTMINPCKVKGIDIFLALARQLPFEFAAVPSWGTTAADRAALQRQPNITLLPPNEDINAILRLSRIVLVPSLWDEAFGLISVEAMLRGIPVLASNVGGLPEAKLGVDYVLPVRQIHRYGANVDERMCPEAETAPQDVLPWRHALEELLYDARRYAALSELSRQTALGFVAGLDIGPLEDLLSKCATPPAKSVAPAPPVVEAGQAAAGSGISDDRRQFLLAKIREKRGTVGTQHAASGVQRRTGPWTPPASFAQERLWFLNQIEPDDPSYNESLAISMSGRLDTGALRACFEELVRRHEILRTRFEMRGGVLVQVVEPSGTIPLKFIDMGDSELQMEATALLRMLRQSAGRPFDLARGPLVRAELLRFRDQQHILLINAHHILVDNWSMTIFFEELTLLYEAFSKGLPDRLPALPIQYGDFAEWERRTITGELLQRRLEFWRDKLTGLPEIQLRGESLRRDSPQGSVTNFALPQQLVRDLRALGSQAGTTLFMTLLAGFHGLLHYYTSQSVIVTGSPVANRSYPGSEKLIGCFSNMIVWSTHLAGELTTAEFLSQVRDEAIDRLANQDTPFEKVVEAMQPERDISKHPLFQVLFAFQNAPAPRFELAGLKLTLLDVSQAVSKFDLFLNISEAGEGLAAALHYRSNLFTAQFIERMARHYQALLAGMAAHPNARMTSLHLLTPAERQQILLQGNETNSRLPEVEGVQQLFEAQVLRTPDAAAVVSAEETVTYYALNRRANQISGLLSARGIAPEQRVGILLKRSIDVAAVVLGILKAGCVFVPLDLQHPTERLGFILAEAEVRLVITTEDLLNSLSDASVPTICLEKEESSIGEGAGANRACRSTRDHLCYVCFTSGSTGAPKGVAMAHEGLVNLAAWHNGSGRLSAPARVLQFAPLSFDVSYQEIFSTLCWGGTLVIMPDELRLEPAKLLDLLARQQIERLFVPVAVLHQLAEAALGSRLALSLKDVITAGEQLRITDQVASWFEMLRDCALHNHYGPTETHAVTALTLTGQPATWPPLPSVGRAIWNTQVYILGTGLEPVPVGVVGELCGGGAGVARGYISRPSLTAERFIPDPFSGKAGSRLYRTGDLARCREDGLIEFLGRKDRQVKIRGYRVELGEIEENLRQHPAVSEAAVVLHEQADQSKWLAAYIVASLGRSTSAGELRAFLSDKLPAYMLPSSYDVVKELPLTTSGKIAFRSLPEPTRPTPSGEREMPLTPIEAIVLDAWRAEFRNSQIGLGDNFFEFGGHSLLATRIILRLRQVLGIDLPINLIWQWPVAADLAAAVESIASRGPTLSDNRLTSCANDGKGPFPLSLLQEQVWLLHNMQPDGHLYTLPARIRLKGPLAVEALEGSLTKLVERHGALRTVFMILGGEPRQVVRPRQSFQLTITDLTEVEGLAREAEARRIADHEALMPFSLETGPLFRCRLLRLAENDNLLLITLHHIICDGWSLDVLIAELMQLYGSLCRQEAPCLDPSPLQYAAYSVWQRELLTTDLFDSYLDYWRTQLGDRRLLLDLPRDWPRPAVPSYCGARQVMRLSPQLTERLKALAAREGLTTYMVFLAGLQILLHAYTRQDAIAVGSPYANRTRPELSNAVGLFVNHLTLITDLSGNPTIREALDRVKNVAIGAYMHQEIPLERFLKEIGWRREDELAPISSVLFLLDPVGPLRLELPTLDVDLESVDMGVCKFDLEVRCAERDGTYTCDFGYSVDLFKPATIERLSRHYARVLEALAAAPEARLAELAILSPAEHLARVRDGNSSPPLSPPPPLPHLHFAALARSRPHAIALSCGHLHLSFAQLNDQANGLARALVDARLGPESIAAVCLDRSPELLICFLAILKAGAVYLPLDPRFPLARLREICQQAQPRVLITRAGLAAELRPLGYRVLEVERVVGQAGRGGEQTEVAAEVSADNAAYVIYTSGSGGRPKGAVLTYGGLRNLVWAQAEVFGRGGEEQRVAMAAPVCFDASIYEMGLSVMQGMCLTIPEREESERGEWLSEHVRREGVTRLVITPTGLGVMSEEGQEGVQELIVCGEKPSEVVLRRWAKGRRIYNAYGPTEASVWATVGEWEEGKKAGVIGRAVSQVEAYVMDGWQRMTAEGVVGELYIGGSGVGRGYVGGGGASAERYVPDGVSGGEGKRLYRTGDMCRYEEGGEIEYVGREDGQVKVRGHRVEVEEVEEGMRRYEKVREAAVVVEEDEEGRKRLRGYVVAEAGERVRSEELRRYLQARLPDFMLPATINEVDSLPLSRAGELARDALPEARSSDEMIAPWADETVEGTVARIWARMLDVSEVGLDDNLLEAGGNSLIAMQLLSRICQAFEVELMLGAFLESPTPRALAPKIKAALSQNREVQLPPALPVQKGELVPTSFAQQRLWFANKVQQDDAFNVPVAMRLSGLLLVSVLRAALARLCQRHEALRTRFVEDQGVPFQVIDGAASVPVPLVDLSGLPADAAARCFDAVAQQEARQPFSLEKSPLFRVRLIRFADDDHVLLLTMHHIITDLWSVALFFREMIEFYDAISAGREPRLPELTLQYADFACWQRQLLERNLFDPQLSYWASKLAGLRPMPLPQLRRESPAHKAASGEAYSFVMEGLKVGGLRRLAGEEQATLFMVLLTAFKITLRRFAATDDVTVATNVYGRNQTWAEGLIGYFINHLLLRTSLSDDISFRELLSRVRRGALEAYSNQDAPFELVVRALRKGGYGEGNPIQALFALQNTPMPALKMRGLSLTPLRLDTRTARLDLALFVQSNPDSLTGYWTYNAQLYERRAIANFSAYYEIVLDIISRSPDALLSAIQREADARYMPATQSTTGALGGIAARRKSVARRNAELFRISPIAPGASLPIVVEASARDADLAAWISTRRGLVENLLLKHGAVLFRGFAVSSAAEFRQAAESMTPTLFGDYGDLTRQPASDKVYWATRYPKDEPILPHNESSHLHHWPLRIWFYCMTAAARGGETPLFDCREVFRRLDPEIIERFRAKGLLYKRHFANHLDVTWQNFYRTSERSKVEECCRASGTQFDWTSNGLRTAQRAPAVTRHPQTGESLFFNQILLHHVSMLPRGVRQSLQALFSEEDLPRNVYYGDGLRIEDDVVMEIRAVYDAAANSFPWQEMDVLMVDNMLTAHGRNPFSGTRKVMVAMGDMIGSDSLTHPMDILPPPAELNLRGE